ncbi:hypothetical protein BJ912DRAFT_921336 [Pholiota molesta]|nr:hypothetical protein BJ912DRAFT_921336 [Pholiota molesta]
MPLLESSEKYQTTATFQLLILTFHVTMEGTREQLLLQVLQLDLKWSFNGGLAFELPDHQGPVSTYMTSCGGSCSTFTANDAMWSKVDGEGHDPSSKQWAAAGLIASCLKGYLHQLIRNEMYLLSVPRNLKDKANTIPLFKYPKSPYNRPRHSFTLVAHLIHGSELSKYLRGLSDLHNPWPAARDFQPEWWKHLFPILISNRTSNKCAHCD